MISCVEPTLGECRDALENLDSWTTMERVGAPFGVSGIDGTAYISREPLGAVLIISAFNYPIQLLLAPLAGAIAAGNCSVLKPSEMSPASSNLMAELVPKYMDKNAIRVVEGAIEVGKKLLDLRWDHILFTGSERVGKIVAAAAAKHLTPITLELGGKCPAIVDRSADMLVAARRIAQGRWLNAGQTCLSPDYVLVERGAAREAFVKAIQQVVKEWYGEQGDKLDEFCKLITKSSFKRVRAMLEEEHGGTIVAGSLGDEEGGHTGSKLGPVVVVNPSRDSTMMQEEIFGPILPILEVDDVSAAIAEVNAKPHPLALYCFTSSTAVAEKVRSATKSGAFCMNETVLHMVCPELPFGGVGSSGMGRYHGKAGFDAMTNPRALLYKSSLLDLAVRYPPHTPTNLAITRAALFTPRLPRLSATTLAIGTTLAAGAAYFAYKSGFLPGAAEAALQAWLPAFLQ